MEMVKDGNMLLQQFQDWNPIVHRGNMIGISYISQNRHVDETEEHTFFFYKNTKYYV